MVDDEKAPLGTVTLLPVNCGAKVLIHALIDRFGGKAVSIELRGQGNPLPPDFPYQGEWILRSRMFLYMPAKARTVPPSVPQFTVSVNIDQDDWSFGFDASHMASALEVTTEEIREANCSGELTLENVWANTPGGEGATKKIYVFGYRGKTVEMAVEQLQQSGTA